MRFLTALVFFMVSSTHTDAINNYKLGDTLFVWAKNGLNIRKEPDANSPVVAKLSFGSQVLIIDEALQTTPYLLEISKIKELDEYHQDKESISERRKSKKKLVFSGFWVKIRTNNTEGYVFDAYLSSLKTLSNDKHPAKYREDYDQHNDLFKINFGLLKQKGRNIYDQNDRKAVSYSYGQEASIEISGGRGGWNKRVIFPSTISLIEGYLIYETMMKENFDSIVFISNTKIKIEVMDGEIIIEIIKGKLVIWEDHSC